MSRSLPSLLPTTITPFSASFGSHSSRISCMPLVSEYALANALSAGLQSLTMQILVTPVTR